MIKNIKKVLIREIKLLYQDKRTLLLVLFLPVLYTAFFGYLYSTAVVNDLKTAVVNYSPSQLSRMIVDGFQSSERFDIIYELSHEEEILPLMEAGKIDVALVIPPNFDSGIKKSKPTEIFIGVNASNLVIGNGALASALQIAETYGVGIGIKKMEATGLTSTLAMDKALSIRPKVRSWYNPSFSYLDFLVMGIMVLAIQQITLMTMANSLVGEKENNTWPGLLEVSGSSTMTIFLGKGLVYFLAGIFSFTGSAFFAFNIYRIPLRGNFISLLLLTIPFIICILIWGLAIAIFCKTRTEATRIIMLLPYPTFLLSGFTWPLFTMSTFYQGLAKIIPLTYYINDLRNIALVGKDLAGIKSSIIALSVLAVVYLVLAYLLFKYKWLGAVSTERKTVRKCLETS